MDNSRFGFKDNDLQAIIQVFSAFPEIQKAAIFGSRAKGNYQSGSDVDIALWVTDSQVLFKITGSLNEETRLPYKFDVLNYKEINNSELKEHVDRAGVEIYRIRSTG